jgi:hypothetical protein
VDTPLRLLTLELGGTLAGQGVIDELRNLMPGVWIAGVEKQPNYKRSSFDLVVSTQHDAFLGCYESVDTSKLAMTPELSALITPFEGKMLNLLGLAALRPTSDYPRPIRGVPKYRDSFDSRKDLLDRHCRFWNYILDHHKIDAVIHENLGQEGYDYIALQLARAKGIPTLVFNIAGQLPRVLFVQEHESGIGRLNFGRELKKRLREELAYEDPNFVRRCLPRFTGSVDSGAHKDSVSQYKTVPMASWLFDRSIYKNALSPLGAITIILRKLGRFAVNPQRGFRTFKRSNYLVKSARRSMKEEALHSREFSQEINYLYFPLSFQPETSTSIKAKNFYRQREIVAFIADALPDDWCLVVKEHPHQFRRLLEREVGFYSQIAAIPKVILVRHTTDNRNLVDNAKAVVCASYSSISTHAAVIGIPVICVGESYFREAPGYFCVETTSNLLSVIELIKNNKVERELGDFDTFITQVEQSTFEGEFGEKFDDLSDEDWARTMAATRHNISRVIREWLRMRGLVN